MIIYNSTFRPTVHQTSLTFSGNNDALQVRPPVDTFAKSPKQVPFFQGKGKGRGFFSFLPSSKKAKETEEFMNSLLGDGADTTPVPKTTSRNRSSSTRGRGRTDASNLGSGYPSTESFKEKLAKLERLQHAEKHGGLSFEDAIRASELQDEIANRTATRNRSRSRTSRPQFTDRTGQANNTTTEASQGQIERSSHSQNRNGSPSTRPHSRGRERNGPQQELRTNFNFEVINNLAAEFIMLDSTFAQNTQENAKLKKQTSAIADKLHNRLDTLNDSPLCPQERIEKQLILYLLEKLYE